MDKFYICSDCYKPFSTDPRECKCGYYMCDECHRNNDTCVNCRSDPGLYMATGNLTSYVILALTLEQARTKLSKYLHSRQIQMDDPEDYEDEIKQILEDLQPIDNDVYEYKN